MDYGAGPCGTLARERPKTSAIAWSLRMLWPQLVQHYATLPRNPYPKLGAKSGGGNNKAALW